MVRRLVLPVSRGVLAVTACLLVPGPAVFSFWDCLKDTEALSLNTVTARRGFPSRSAALCAAIGLPDAVCRHSHGREWCARSLGDPFTEAVFADERCKFAVSLPTVADASGAEDYSLGFLGWLLLGFVDESAWTLRCSVPPSLSNNTHPLHRMALHACFAWYAS